MNLVVILILAQWVNVPAAKTPLSAPTPKTADGKPDLSGVWEAEGQTYFFDLAAGLKPEDVVPLPWAQALQKQREENIHGDDPLGRCLPHGVPRINTNGLFPVQDHSDARAGGHSLRATESVPPDLHGR